MADSIHRVDAEVRGHQPVTFIPSDSERDQPEEGIALCLSGGGYRAMLFHVGGFWRLNEAGLLPKLDRISSVSGGSITAGVLGLRWNALAFDNKGVGQQFRKQVVDPIRSLADCTIDESSILSGALLPGTSISDRVIKAYDKYLYSGASLQQLPDRPRFVINATNVQSGALWRFSKPYMADYRVGRILAKTRTVSLATAVAASSAFPPFLSPVELSFRSSDFEKDDKADLQFEPFTTEVVLSDGGVYDNLGLETAWKNYKTVLVSDGGGKMAPEESPKRDWARHSFRILSLIDNQVRSLRLRQLMDSLESEGGQPPVRKGAYWGIRTPITKYEKAAFAQECKEDRTRDLAETPTRLKKMDGTRQERLINWGYAICDAALRTHYLKDLPKPSGFPYPNAGV